MASVAVLLHIPSLLLRGRLAAVIGVFNIAAHAAVMIFAFFSSVPLSALAVFIMASVAAHAAISYFASRFGNERFDTESEVSGDDV